MSTFSALAKGTRAVKEVDFDLPGGALVRCGVRPLLGAEEADVLGGARKFAIARGVKEPRDGDPIYELGIWVHTLLASCVDVESPEKAAPFFDGGAEQILDNLDRDRIALLFELQQSWQDEASPRPRKIGADEFIAKVLEIANGRDDDDGPFVRWRPVLRWSFVRTLAGLYVSSLLPKSPSGSDSETSTGDTTSSGSS